MQRFYKIIVVSFLLLAFFAKAQCQPAFSVKGALLSGMQESPVTGVQNCSKKVFENRLKQVQPPIQGSLTRNYLRSDFYTAHLAFFCRGECQLEKSLNIPLRFRLGSLQYTDALEGKRGSSFIVK